MTGKAAKLHGLRLEQNVSVSRPSNAPWLIAATRSKTSPVQHFTRPDSTGPSENGDDAVSETRSAEQLPKPLPDIDSVEGIRECLKRARNGETAVRPLVRKMLEHDEEGILLNHYGDIFAWARTELVKIAAGNNITVQEALCRKIEAVRDELAGPNPTPLERILCERVALCWFDANETDRRFGIERSGISFQDAEYRESRRDRAHRRFLAACKTLASVRRLAGPAIQVNIARKQVNVAGGAS
jgi:hypothetical protein